MPVLSDDFVRRFSLGDRPERIIRDTRLAGFALRVRRRADGSMVKTWFVIHEMPVANGSRRRRKIMIGDSSAFPADNARAEAQAMLRAIKRGDDPAAARAAKKAQPVFENLVEDFDATHIAEKKPATRADYRGRIRRSLLPYFKGRRVADITPAMVRDFHRQKRATPTDANRCVAVLSVMMGRAVELGWRTDNPCVSVQRNRENVRERWLDEHDMPKFVAALANAKGPFADCIRFLTITGWRVSEARTLTWDMVDLPRLVVRLPDSKTGATTRALSTDAAHILDRQAHRIGFVFSARRGFPVSYKQLRTVLTEISVAAGLESITPHVLRHSAATWAAIAGAEAHELREAFGWKTLAMTARYVSRSESLGRRGVQRAADAINVFGRVSV